MQNLKKAILILCLFLISSLGFASDSSWLQSKQVLPPDFAPGTHEVGVNATQFFSTYLSFSSGFIGSTDPHFITYKFHLNRNNALRFGIGGRSFSENEHKGQPSNITLKNNHYDLRFGYERRKNVNKRFTAYAGADAGYGKLSIESQQTSFGTDQRVLHVNNTESYRISAIGGLQFRVNNWLAIQTEARYVWQYQETVNETKYKKFQWPVEDQKRSDFRKTTTFFTPTDIYFVVTF